MGSAHCCSEIQPSKASEQDLSANIIKKVVTGENKVKSADLDHQKSLSSRSKGSKNQSRRNLQIKLMEIGGETGSKMNNSMDHEVHNFEKVKIGSGPELFLHGIRSSVDFSNPCILSPTSNHQTNYIVVVEAEEQGLPRRRDTEGEDLSKSRSIICKSIEKAIDDRNVSVMSRSNQLGLDEPHYRHDYLYSRNTVIQKQEKSIMQSRTHIDNLDSGRTIEYSLAAGKYKEWLTVNSPEELNNLDRFSETKFMKAWIELDDFKDSMTRKFINATSVIQSNYIKVKINL